MDSVPARRLIVCGLPVDDVDPDDGSGIVSTGTGGKNHHILFLSAFGFARAKLDPRSEGIVRGARLVIPTSRRIAALSRKRTGEAPRIHDPCTFTIRLLGALETAGGSVCLLGGDESLVDSVSSRLELTFPGLHLVGRYPGSMLRRHMADVLRAMRKAAPSLVLAGAPVPGGDGFLPPVMMGMDSGLYLHHPALFRTFAGKSMRRRIVL